jgi:hypothetical protein
MNDTSGWTLVHDRARAVVTDAIEQVRALRDGDRAAASTLADWWRAFSRSLVHHFASEDTEVWRALEAADPGSSVVLDTMPEQHRSVTALLGDVDAAMDRLTAAVRTGAAVESAPRDTALDRLTALRETLDGLLAREEAAALPVMRERVSADEWDRLSRSMVQGLSLGEVADLLPGMLAVATPEARAAMLRRVPAPVRVLDRVVLEPRYRRRRKALPLHRQALVA